MGKEDFSSSEFGALDTVPLLFGIYVIVVIVVKDRWHKIILFIICLHKNHLISHEKLAKEKFTRLILVPSLNAEVIILRNATFLLFYFFPLSHLIHPFSSVILHPWPDLFPVKQFRWSFGKNVSLGILPWLIFYGFFFTDRKFQKNSFCCVFFTLAFG